MNEEQTELTLMEHSVRMTEKIQSDIDEIKTTLKILTEAIVQSQKVTGSIHLCQLLIF